LPYIIEGTFYVIGQAQNGPEQHHQTHSDKNSAFGVHQIGVNQAKNGFGSRTLSFKTATELGFQQVGEAETACDGE